MSPLLLVLALAAAPDDARFLPDLPNEASARFDDAERARRAGDFAGAAAAYLDAERVAPSYSPFARRACGALLASGKRDEAIRACRRAVELAKNAPNALALATALSSAGARDAELDEARAILATPGVKDDPFASCEVVVITSTRAMADCMKPRVDRESPPPPPPRSAPWRRAIPIALVLVASLITYLVARGVRRSPPDPLAAARRALGDARVLLAAHLPPDPVEAVDRLLALADDGPAGIDCEIFEQEGARVLVLATPDRRWEARLPADPEVPALAPIFEVVNLALEHHGARGKIVLTGTAIVYATPAERASL